MKESNAFTEIEITLVTSGWCCEGTKKRNLRSQAAEEDEGRNNGSKRSLAYSVSSLNFPPPKEGTVLSNPLTPSNNPL